MIINSYITYNITPFPDIACRYWFYILKTNLFFLFNVRIEIQNQTLCKITYTKLIYIIPFLVLKNVRYPNNRCN